MPECPQTIQTSVVLKHEQDLVRSKRVGTSKASGTACVKGWRPEDAETVCDWRGVNIGPREDRVGLKEAFLEM